MTLKAHSQKHSVILEPELLCGGSLLETSILAETTGVFEVSKPDIII